MFEQEKIEIKKQISNKKITDINDDTAKELRKIAETAESEKNFQKMIACHEIILDDLGIDNPNAFGAKVGLLTAYSNCGLSESKEALDLTLKLLKEVMESENPNTVLPDIHIPAIKILYSTNDEAYKQMAIQCGKSAVEVGIRLAENYGYNVDFINLSARELMKIYIKEGKYDEADDFFFSLPETCLHENLDLIINALNAIMYAYGLCGTNDEFVEIAIDKLKAMQKIPEAKYILGIMAAEGYHTQKDTNTAQKYFSEADKLIQDYRGTVGYSDYEFSVLSDITQEEIIKQAQLGEYHSKFYKARKNSKQITQPTNSNNSSSGGCYVATCIYGSYDCPEVWTLRRFRDNILSKNFFGRQFIKLYYATSPTAVRLFGNQLWFHKLFKSPLDKLVAKLQNIGVENTPYNDK